MRFLIKMAAVVMAAFVSSGCATITTGTSQSIAIATDPAGADCTFTRNNQFLARVNPTPGAMHIDKSSADITVLCKREGYQETAGNIGSEFQGATLGNIILGGIIGIVVDAASGAASKYPESISFTLLPVEFRSADERDRFFSNLNTTFVTEYAEIIARIKQSCQPADCDSQLKTAEAAKTAHVASIERRRLLAKISSAPVADAPSSGRAATTRAPSRLALNRTEAETLTRGRTWVFGALETGGSTMWEFSGSGLYSTPGRGSMRTSGAWHFNSKDELCIVWSSGFVPNMCLLLARDGDRLVIVNAATDAVYSEVKVR